MRLPDAEAGQMRVEVLTIPGCPNGPVVMARLGLVLAGRPAVQVVHRLVADDAEAASSGMRGSPTILVDGRDPFAAPDTPTSASCRLYRDAAGQLSGAPSVAELRRVLS